MDLFVVDELGRMEFLCPAFEDAGRLLLDRPVPLVATVALQGKGPSEEAEGRDDVWLVEMAANRKARRQNCRGG